MKASSLNIWENYKAMLIKTRLEKTIDLVTVLYRQWELERWSHRLRWMSYLREQRAKLRA